MDHIWTGTGTGGQARVEGRIREKKNEKESEIRRRVEDKSMGLTHMLFLVGVFSLLCSKSSKSMGMCCTFNYLFNYLFIYLGLIFFFYPCACLHAAAMH